MYSILDVSFGDSRKNEYIDPNYRQNLRVSPPRYPRGYTGATTAPTTGWIDCGRRVITTLPSRTQSSSSGPEQYCSIGRHLGFTGIDINAVRVYADLAVLVRVVD